MPIPLAVIEALPLIREAACSGTGRAAVRSAVTFTCGPKAKGFVARAGQALLKHGAVGGPLVPLVCRMGGPAVVEPVLDTLCNTPPEKLEAKFRELEAKTGAVRGGARALIGEKPKITTALSGFYGR